MASKLTKALGMAVGSAVLAGLPPGSEAAPINEIEPNNSFPGQPVTATDIISGAVDNINPAFPPTPNQLPDPVDFFQYSGLTAGSFFDVFVELTGLFDNEQIFAETDSSTQNLLDFEVIPGQGSAHLTGIVPADGKLVVGITILNQNSFSSAEEYRITLNTRAAVPVPASLVLVAAGLVGLGGLHVARRRRAA